MHSKSFRMMNFIKIFLVILILSPLSLSGRDYIILQSTTSTANTGLLDLLSREFFLETGIEVRSVAVGTGTAINNAKKGDGDVLMVHSKSDEIQFIKEGYGVERFDLMYNDFVIIGPKSDPAKIKKKNDIDSVMETLADPKYKFISRDDNSGTYKKEIALWSNRGSEIFNNPSYIKTGSGMASTINIASEMQAYTLTDRGTWISFTNKKNLAILFEGDEKLFNPYGVIVVNPKKFPHIEYEKSMLFINWLLQGNGYKLINDYRIKDQQLFFTYEN